MEPPVVVIRLLLVICLVACLLSINNVGVEASHVRYPEFMSESAHQLNTMHRTAFHFQPPKHWINGTDPNGPMYYNGLYHFFYQYNPKGAVWGNIVWAHSVSTDLIHWGALKPAITTSKPFDVNGCWSGSVTILPDNTPVILYTGVDTDDRQVQNYAIPKNKSDPYLLEWIKPDDNPIIDPSHDNVNQSAFRDPTTAWWDQGHWKLVVGSERNHCGVAYLYRSKDFRNWAKAKHPLHSRTGTGMWECPDFYPVGVNGNNGLDTSDLEGNVKHVFKVSLDATRYDYYTLGTYDRKMDRYIPDEGSVDGWSGLRYDYGNFYASKTFYDPVQNRRILWGWANESDTKEDDVRKGWAGIQVIPRTVLLDDSGKQLIQWPIVELENLRRGKIEMTDRILKLGENVVVKGITAAQADVDVTFSFGRLERAKWVERFDPSWAGLDALDVCAKMGSRVQGGVGPFGLLTLASENLEEYTPVFFRIFMDGTNYRVLMCSDATSSSLKNDIGMYKPSFAGYVQNVDLTSGKLSLRSLIDRSVVESFGAGGKTCIVSRVYPTLAVDDNAHLFVFNNGTHPITVESLSAWNMKKPRLMKNN